MCGEEPQDQHVPTVPEWSRLRQQVGLQPLPFSHSLNICFVLFVFFKNIMLMQMNTGSLDPLDPLIN